MHENSVPSVGTVLPVFGHKGECDDSFATSVEFADRRWGKAAQWSVNCN